MLGEYQEFIFGICWIKRLLRRTKDKVKYTAGYVNLELKEEDLLAHYILNVLLENIKVDNGWAFASLAKLGTMTYLNFTKSG